MSGKVKIITEWIRCPVCGNKTRLQIRADTELKNFPLYCPKFKRESLIDAKELQVTVIKSIETKMQSWLTKWQIGSCRLIFRQPLYFQGIFAVKCLILMFCPCFCPYQPKQGQVLYCPTTISSSSADFFFASQVAWAYTFIVVLTSECPRSSCTSFGCAPFSNRFVV